MSLARRRHRSLTPRADEESPGEVSLIVLDTEGLAYSTNFSRNVRWVTRLTDSLLNVKKPYVNTPKNVCALNNAPRNSFSWEHGESCHADGADRAHGGQGTCGRTEAKLECRRHLVPSYDGYVYCVYEQNQSHLLQIHVRDIVNFTPFRTPLLEGVYLEGSRNSSVMALDFDTGSYIARTIHEVDPKLPAGPASGPTAGNARLRQLHIGYTDWTVRAFDEKTHEELWSFNWREIGAVNSESMDPGVVEQVRNIVTVEGKTLQMELEDDEGTYTEDMNFPFPIAAVFAVVWNESEEILTLQLVERVSIPPPAAFLQNVLGKTFGPGRLTSSSYFGRNLVSVRNGVIDVQKPWQAYDEPGANEGGRLIEIKTVDKQHYYPLDARLRHLTITQQANTRWHAVKSWCVFACWFFALALAPVLGILTLLKRFLPLEFFHDVGGALRERSRGLPGSGRTHSSRSVDSDESRHMGVTVTVESSVIHLGEDEMTREDELQAISVVPHGTALADFLENGRFLRTFSGIKLLGKGGFGSVYRAQHKLEPGNPTYAIKLVLLKLKASEGLTSRRYFREVAANREISSKYVVRYFTWWCEEPHFLPLTQLTPEIQSAAASNVKHLVGLNSLNPERSKALTGFMHHYQEMLRGIVQKTGEDGSPQSGSAADACGRIQRLLALDGDSEGDDGLVDDNDSMLNGNFSRQSVDEQTGEPLMQYSESSGGVVFEYSNPSQAPDDSSDSDSSSDTSGTDSDESIDRHQSRAKETEKHYPVVLLILMELCKGFTLREWLNRPQRSDQPMKYTLSENGVPIEFDLFRQLIKGLRDIHANKFIHRDLKPENVFVDPATNALKIGDFGLVGFISQSTCETSDTPAPEVSPTHFSSEQYQSSVPGQIIGTPGYTAPEGGVNCSEKADIFSASLVLLELLSPRFPTVMERFTVLENFRNAGRVPDFIAERLQPWHQLLMEMGDRVPERRPSAVEVQKKLKLLYYLVVGRRSSRRLGVLLVVRHGEEGHAEVVHDLRYGLVEEEEHAREPVDRRADQQRVEGGRRQGRHGVAEAREQADAERALGEQAYDVVDADDGAQRGGEEAADNAGRGRHGVGQQVGQEHVRERGDDEPRVPRAVASLEEEADKAAEPLHPGERGDAVHADAQQVRKPGEVVGHERGDGVRAQHGRRLEGEEGAAVVVQQLHRDHDEVRLRHAQGAVRVDEGLELALTPDRAQHVHGRYAAEQEDGQGEPPREYVEADVGVKDGDHGVHAVVQQLAERRADAELARLLPVDAVERLRTRHGRDHERDPVGGPAAVQFGGEGDDDVVHAEDAGGAAEGEDVGGDALRRHVRRDR
ncbi:PEK protein kinase [Babesia caballi]|uniref:non-specific serine/threonine protein kinase n=1 Tax=Babesia caballi TaxID=5871 RepID=A0AAV4LTY1_BABCB|nr:PEK protein kinase [Babesia caballi]